MIIPSAGCSTKNAKNKYKLFYKNASSNKLVTVDYSTQTQELDELVPELLNKMNQKVKNKKLSILKPEEVNIEKCDIKNNTVNIYFNNGYNDMSEYDELFYRAGVVKMLTQIDDISYVQFYVGDSQAKYKDGSYIGLMTKDSFVDDTNESLGNIEWRKVDLYYSNKMGELSPETLEAAHLDGVNSFQEFIYIVLPFAFPTASVFLVTGVATICTNQYNIFSFYGGSVAFDSGTMGYYLFNLVQDYASRNVWDVVWFNRAAALSLIVTLIVVPITMGIRWVLDKYGPQE